MVLDSYSNLLCGGQQDMTVIPFGPCHGAINAFKLASETILKHKTVYYTENILHNRHVMNMLHEKGRLIQAAIEDVPEGAAYLISAHGAPPKTYQIAAERSVTVCDLTCPHIKNIQARMRTEISDGGTLFIIGIKRHQEIVALAACNHPNPTYVIEDAQNLMHVPTEVAQPVRIQLQTTIPALHVEELIAVIEEKYAIKARSPDRDLCAAIRQRLDYIEQLPKSQQIVHVLGSETSQNTRTMMKAISMVGKTPVLINELPPSDGRELHTIITATSHIDREEL